MENGTLALITDQSYCISKDPDYVKVDYNESTKKYIRDKATFTLFKFNNIRHAMVPNTKISKNVRRLQTLDLSDSGGDLNLVIDKVKKWVEVTEVRNESFSVVTSAGVGIQQKDKVGYKILYSNGDKKAVTAYLSETLGVVNDYDDDSTECIIQAFNMDKAKYDSQEIGGALGLKNTGNLLYDVSPKDIGIISLHICPICVFRNFL